MFVKEKEREREGFNGTLICVVVAINTEKLKHKNVSFPKFCVFSNEIRNQNAFSVERCQSQELYVRVTYSFQSITNQGTQLKKKM